MSYHNKDGWAINMIDVDYIYTILHPAKEFFTYMDMSPLPVKGCKFKPLLNAQDFGAKRDLYRATPALTWHIGFSGLIRETVPFSRVLRHMREYGGSILALTGSSRILLIWNWW
jgi:hypothetical protein